MEPDEFDRLNPHEPLRVTLAVIECRQGLLKTTRPVGYFQRVGSLHENDGPALDVWVAPEEGEYGSD